MLCGYLSPVFAPFSTYKTIRESPIIPLKSMGSAILCPESFDIHTSEHLDERRLMVQWWADYLNANQVNHITPFEFAKNTKNQG